MASGTAATLVMGCQPLDSAKLVAAHGEGLLTRSKTLQT